MNPDLQSQLAAILSQLVSGSQTLAPQALAAAQHSARIYGLWALPADLFGFAIIGACLYGLRRLWRH